MRLPPAAAIARSLPSLISGSSELIAPMNMSMRPASRSGIAAVAPRNGTWIRSTPACILNSSPPRCCGVPTPTEPKVSLFGEFLASAMNSCTVRAGRVGGTTMTKGTSATRLIGAKSVIGL